MNWFDNIKIRNKLFLVFGMLLCFMLSFAAFSAMQLHTISGHLIEVSSTNQGRQRHVADALADVYRMRVTDLFRGYLLEDEALLTALSDALDDYEAWVELFQENMVDYRVLMLTNPWLNQADIERRMAAVEGVDLAFTSYAQVSKKVHEAVQSRNKDRINQAVAEAIITGNILSDQLQNLRDIIFFTTTQQMTATKSHTAQTVNVIFAITAGFVLLTVIALNFAVRNINRPITALENAVTEIAHGNLAYPIRSERKDELGSLANGIGDMVDAISEHTKMTAIMDNLDSRIFVVDFGYKLLFANKRAVDAYKLHEKDYVGQKCHKVIRNQDQPCAICRFPQLSSQNLPFQTIDYEIYEDLLQEWVGGTDSVIRWVDGSLVFFQSNRDVTQKKHQETLLQEALQEAKAASLAKSSFLADMSHEIRTPMNAILGITDIQLQNPALSQDTKEALARIYSSSDLLLGIINDMLDMSKIEAGKLELAPVEYDVASLLVDTTQLNLIRKESKPIEFELNVEEGMPAMVVGDVLRVKQILNNILSNAFKYTKKGAVSLSVSHEAGNEASFVTLVFRVSDTGQGMTAEQVEKLFDKYTRFNMETNRTIEGTGLGMSITRKLVHMMNGDLAVESEAGRGSTFTVRLPPRNAGAGVLTHDTLENLRRLRITVPSQMKRSQIVREQMPYGRVLVVDDVETNLYVAKGLLTPYGLTIETVESGFAAIKKIKQGKVYDIV
ncbi:MAG: HAMP domain-containing protein, partial [Deltaproteobacteria bacterium]|nr:HAMP domain-containing protein [Deltaproteobacteria bacterium]